MQTITQKIFAQAAAGVQAGYSAAIAGRTLLILACDQGNVLNITFRDAAGHQYVANGVGAAFKVTPRTPFTHVDITTPSDANVSFIVSDGDVDVQLATLGTTVNNTGANPVPVNVAGGNVTVTATNVGINNTPANPVPVELHVSDITLPVAQQGALPAGTNVIGHVIVDSGAVTVGNTNAAPVPVIDAYQAPSTAAWTSATAANTALTLNTQGYDTVIFTIAPSGSITGGAITFEVNDGSNWIPLKAPRTDSYQTDTTFALAGAALHSWQLPVAGYPSVRARLSTAITGTGTANLVAIVSSAPDVSLVTVGIDPSQPLPAGTNTIGAVNLNDPSIARSLAGTTFSQAVISAASSGQYAQAQLWNPVGSGVNLYVQQAAALLTSASPGTVWAYLNNTQAASDGGQGYSKNAGAAVSKAHIRFGTQGTAPSTPAIGMFGLPAQGLAAYPGGDPICIPPGYGLTLVYNAVATQMSAMFEWFEQ